MNDREIMQQALEALIKAHPYSNSNKDLDGHSEAIVALGERLAQPDPLQRFTDVQQEIESALAPEQERREWQGLTDEEISAISKSIPGETVIGAAMRLFAREIEAKLKEKNT